MRILFLTVDVEYSLRGIGAILKNLIRAAREDGHEVGLLTGIPYERAYGGNAELRDRIEHVHLQHYVIDGKKSFRVMLPGGYRRRNLYKFMLKGKFLKHAYMKVRPELLSGKRNLAHELDFIVRAPFIYRFIAKGNDRISRYVVGRICRAYSIDLVVAVSPTKLRSKDLGSHTKLATFIHDIMPVEMLETPAESDTPIRFARELETAIRHSDLLMANSTDTANKINALFPKAQVDVVYGVVSSAPSEITDSAILTVKNLQPNNYLLFAAMIEKRKNVEGLIDAYALAYDELRMPLVIVGAPGYGFEQLIDKYEALPQHIQNNVLFTGFVSEEDKFTLFKNARAFVFPSFYEGIGIPVIEAMSYGIPVLTTRTGALPEAAGNGAFYIENPYDVQEIAHGLIRITKDENLRKQLVSNGSSIHKDFTFSKFKQRVGKSLQRIDGDT